MSLWLSRSGHRVKVQRVSDGPGRRGLASKGRLRCHPPGGRVGGLGPGWPLQSWGARLAQLAGVASELEVGLEAWRGTEARAGETESRS